MLATGSRRDCVVTICGIRGLLVVVVVTSGLVFVAVVVVGADDEGF